MKWSDEEMKFPLNECCSKYFVYHLFFHLPPLMNFMPKALIHWVYSILVLSF